MLFMHSTDDYDVVVQLNPTILPRYYQNIVADVSVWKAGKYANSSILQQNEEQGPLLPCFDPARLLFNDLQVRDGQLCLVDGASIDFFDSVPTRTPSRSSPMFWVEINMVWCGIQRCRSHDHSASSGATPTCPVRRAREKITKARPLLH